MITTQTVRDLALTIGAAALAAMAADELSGGRLRTVARPAATAPTTRHGWVYALDSLSGAEIRVRPRRPATAAEAQASTASAAAGDGGWIGLGADGAIYAITDPTVVTEGGRTWSTARIDVVYVAGARADSPLHTLARTVTARARTVHTLLAHLRADRAARILTPRGPILRNALGLTDDATVDESGIRLTADVIALAQRDGVWHVLLIRRAHDPYTGRWALPGGHVDPGESTTTAAARELAEETGIVLDETALDYVDTYTAPGRDPRGTYMTEAFLAVLPDMPTPTADSDAAAAQWLPATTALADGLAFDHADILRDALAQARPDDDATDPWDLTSPVPVAGVDELLDEVLVQGELDDPANGTDTRLR